MEMSWPSISEPKAKAPTQGCSPLSTVLIGASPPEGVDSNPIETQLSAASSGKNVRKAGLIPPAVVEPN